ncbi:MAG: hypothetical protein WBW74_10965 [Xanthobacteraceae bacterium]
MMRSLLVPILLLAAGSPALTQDAGVPAAAYCDDLKRVAGLAMTEERFISIAGRPREGNFRETSLALAGWTNCALYGAGTYTCDSPALGSAEDAERAQAAILRQIKACLGAGWAEAAARSSSDYVVLHSALRPVSITLSTDETDDDKHLIHLTMFVRRNQVPQ